MILIQTILWIVSGIAGSYWFWRSLQRSDSPKCPTYAQAFQISFFGCFFGPVVIGFTAIVWGVAFLIECTEKARRPDSFWQKRICDK